MRRVARRRLDGLTFTAAADFHTPLHAVAAHGDGAAHHRRAVADQITRPTPRCPTRAEDAAIIAEIDERDDELSQPGVPPPLLLSISHVRKTTPKSSSAGRATPSLGRWRFPPDGVPFSRRHATESSRSRSPSCAQLTARPQGDLVRASVSRRRRREAAAITARRFDEQVDRCRSCRARACAFSLRSMFALLVVDNFPMAESHSARSEASTLRGAANGPVDEGRGRPRRPDRVAASGGRAFDGGGGGGGATRARGGGGGRRRAVEV